MAEERAKGRRGGGKACATKNYVDFRLKERFREGFGMEIAVEKGARGDKGNEAHARFLECSACTCIGMR